MEEQQTTIVTAILKKIFYILLFIVYWTPVNPLFWIANTGKGVLGYIIYFLYLGLGVFFLKKIFNMSWPIFCICLLLGFDLLSNNSIILLLFKIIRWKLSL